MTRKQWYESSRVPSEASALIIKSRLEQKGWKCKITKKADGWYGVWVWC